MRGAEPLVLDDRAGRNRLDLVKHSERQRDIIVQQSRPD
jgi:hypothetical protein